MEDGEMDRQAVLTEYVKQELLKGRKIEVAPHTDLLSAGVVDSLGLLKLVSFVEERFGFAVPDEDVVYENFSSIQALTNYLNEQASVAGETK
jgi:acyl carrier protein